MAFLAGIAYGIVAISSQTQLQEDLPEEVRGRVFGVLNMLVSVGSFLPIIIVGPISDLLGTTQVLLIVAALILVSGVVSIVRRGPLMPAEVRATAGTIVPGTAVTRSASPVGRSPGASGRGAEARPRQRVDDRGSVSADADASAAASAADLRVSGVEPRDPGGWRCRSSSSSAGRSSGSWPPVAPADRWIVASSLGAARRARTRSPLGAADGRRSVPVGGAPASERRRRRSSSWWRRTTKPRSCPPSSPISPRRITGRDGSPLFEVVVVDDRSSDGTGDSARSGGSTRLPRCGPDRPSVGGQPDPYEGCRSGGDRRRGLPRHVIVVLDADARIGPDFLRRDGSLRGTQAFRRSRRAGGCSGPGGRFSPGRRPTSRRRMANSSGAAGRPGAARNSGATGW